MITGDKKETAVAIAKECNILTTDTPGPYEVMLGKDFRDRVGPIVYDPWDDERVYPKVANIDEMRKVDTHLRVLARANPEDKFLMVIGLRQLNHIVAMTGDGTNDAMSLKRANVGFAMGISGT